jgi:general secretion pathway protein D
MMLGNLRALVAVSLAAWIAVGPFAAPVGARTRKGDKFFKEGQSLEARQLWDQAAEQYQKAVDEDPRDAGYLVGMRRAREQSALEHVSKARELRSAGNLAEAIAELERAIFTDPSLSIALQELKRTQEMLTSNAPPGQANLTPYERAQKDASDRSASIMSAPELRPPVRRVGPLKMNNQPMNIIYSTVANIAGVNVVWDSTYTNRPTRGFDVDLPEMSVEQAFDFISNVTRTFWKPLTATTIFVTEESANKRRDFTDQITKTLYVTNAASAQEFNEIQTAVRTITDIRRVYPYVAQKAIVVRGDVDAVNLAEKLVRDLDKPKSEVVIDVIVMQANSARTKDLAATIQNAAGGFGVNVPVAFNPRPGIGTTVGTGTNALNNFVPLNKLPRLSTADWATTLPGALLQAIISDSSTKILNSPQLRASEGQKARLEVGDRIPIASGSFQTGVTGTTGVGVNTTFQYQPVGVIVDITPTQVHSIGEVTLHIEFEISAVKNYVNVGNIQQPVVTQNKSTADLRLREGEINILAGLNQNQDTETMNGIAGLTNIPAFKYLFGANHTEKDRGDMMIALIPHIVRSPDYSPENLRGVFAGADQQLRLMYQPKPGENSGSAPPDATPQVPGAPPAAPNPAAIPPAPTGGTQLTFDPATLSVNANAPFTVNVQLQNAADAFSVTPLRVTWDPALLRMNDIAPGDLLTRDGGRVTSVKDIRNDMGQATLTISRAAGASGINGSGNIATLTFVAAAPGTARVNISEFGLRDTQNRTAQIMLGSVPVTIR